MLHDSDTDGQDAIIVASNWGSSAIRRGPATCSGSREFCLPHSDLERQVVQRANGANPRVSFLMQHKTQWARVRRRVSNSIRVCVFGASARGETGVNELQQARVFFAVHRHHFE